MTDRRRLSDSHSHSHTVRLTPVCNGIQEDLFLLNSILIHLLKFTAVSELNKIFHFKRDSCSVKQPTLEDPSRWHITTSWTNVLETVHHPVIETSSPKRANLIGILLLPSSLPPFPLPHAHRM